MTGIRTQAGLALFIILTALAVAVLGLETLADDGLSPLCAAAALLCWIGWSIRGGTVGGGMPGLAILAGSWVLLIGVFWPIGKLAVEQATPSGARALAELVIRADEVGPDGVLIGRRNLGQGGQRVLDESAAPEHLRISRRRDGTWEIANISSARRAYLSARNGDADVTRYLRRTPVEDGLELRLDGRSLLFCDVVAGSETAAARIVPGVAGDGTAPRVCGAGAPGDLYAYNIDGVIRIRRNSRDPASAFCRDAIGGTGSGWLRGALEYAHEVGLWLEATKQSDRARAAMRLVGEDPPTERRIARIGGPFTCEDLVAVPGVPFDSARLMLAAEGLALAPGRGDALGVSVAFRRPGDPPDAAPTGFSDVRICVPFPCDAGSAARAEKISLTLGRTIYAVSVDAGELPDADLRFRPLRHLHMIAPNDADEIVRPEETWLEKSVLELQGLHRPLLGVPSGPVAALAGVADAVHAMGPIDGLVQTLARGEERWAREALAMFVGLLAAACLAARPLRRFVLEHPVAGSPAVWVAIVGLAGMIFLVLRMRNATAENAGALLPLALALASWMIASLTVAETAARFATSRRQAGMPPSGALLWAALLGLFWWAMLALIFGGGHALLQLGVGVRETQWLVYPQKQYQGIAIAGLVVSATMLAPSGWYSKFLNAMADPRDWGTALLRASLVIGFLAMLGVWVGFGSEEGVFGVQPVEFAKFVAAMSAAVLLCRADRLLREGADPLDERVGRQRRWTVGLWAPTVLCLAPSAYLFASGYWLSAAAAAALVLVFATLAMQEGLWALLKTVMGLFAELSVLGMMFFFSPTLRSDMSPMLIILLTLLGLGAIGFAWILLSALERWLSARDGRTATPPDFFRRLPRLKAMQARGFAGMLRTLPRLPTFTYVGIILLLGWQSIHVAQDVRDPDARADYESSQLGKLIFSSTVKDRFEVWDQPGAHPENGLQVNRSRELVLGAPERAVFMINDTPQMRETLCANAPTPSTPHEAPGAAARAGAPLLERAVERIGEVSAVAALRGLALPILCGAPDAPRDFPSEIERRADADAAQDLRAPSLFGPNGHAISSVPAVQDDYIGAFLLFRFGYSWGAALMALQVAVVILGVLPNFSHAEWRRANRRQTNVRQMLTFITLGGSILLSLHWTISWSNVFGALPVMGQPMTWLTAGRSHIFSMALPVLAASLISFRLAGEGWPRVKSRVFGV